MFAVLIVLSVLTGAYGVLVPRLVSKNGDPVWIASFPFLVLCLVIVAFSVKRFGARGLWTLVGLPMALLWPMVMALIYAACRWGHDCI